MKQYASACVITLFLTLPSMGSAASNPTLKAIPQPWSLQQAVEYALANNPETDIATKRLDAAGAALASSRTFDYPEVSLVTEYSQTDTPMYSFGNILNQGAFDQTIDFNDPGRTDDLLLRAQVQYRLYDGGRTSSTIDMVQAQGKTAEQELAVVHQLLAFQVVQSYHVILQAQEMLQVRKSAVKAIGASVDVARARYGAGDLLKEDLLNLELQKVRAQEDAIRADHRLQLAERTFWNLLGAENKSDLALPVIEVEQQLPPDSSFERRRELQAAEAMIEAARAEVAKNESGTRPTVDAFAHYQYEYGTVLDESGDSWLAGVRMNYTLYNGNRTAHDTASAKAKLLSAQAEKQKLRLALSLELQQATIMHRQAMEKLQVTQKMVEVAEESANLSRLRFQEGVILASDLIDTEMRLTDAHARHTSAKAERAIAVANLRKTTGLDQF